MSYREALVAAGAVVEQFEEFGDYQGTWYALVNVEGTRFWVNGSYGSCSGCDAFEAEFGYNDRDPEKLAKFGASYLADPLSQAQVEKMASANLEWDMEAQAVVDFLRKHSIA